MKSEPVRLSGSRLTAKLEPDPMLITARVEELRRYRWSSYSVYVCSARNPGWLTAAETYPFFADHTLHSLGRLPEATGRDGRACSIETGWKEEIKAAVAVCGSASLENWLAGCGVLRSTR